MVLLLLASRSDAQTPHDQSVEEFWPTISSTIELGHRVRLQTTAENHSGVDGPFTQWELSAILSYRAMRKLRLRQGDNDEENKHDLTVGAGYMFVQQDENGVVQGEHRILVESTPKHSLGLGFLLQDRNRIEFRWRENGYDFRYRNRLMIDRPIQIRGFKFIPYAFGELFWARNAHAWDENRYAFGLRLPYKKSVMVDFYYLRKNCTGCRRTPTNAAGLTVNLYLRYKKS